MQVARALHLCNPQRRPSSTNVRTHAQPNNRSPSNIHVPIQYSHRPVPNHPLRLREELIHCLLAARRSLKLAQTDSRPTRASWLNAPE
jgi:hypothetical protein